VCILIRVRPNESGDCPASESDSANDRNQSTVGYCDPLVDEFWGLQEGDKANCSWETNAESTMYAEEVEFSLRDLSLREKEVK
jgi:hypothetical protein